MNFAHIDKAVHVSTDTSQLRNARFVQFFNIIVGGGLWLSVQFNPNDIENQVRPNLAPTELVQYYLFRKCQTTDTNERKEAVSYHSLPNKSNINILFQF